MSEPPSPVRYPASIAADIPSDSPRARELEQRRWQSSFQLPPTSAPQVPAHAAALPQPPRTSLPGPATDQLRPATATATAHLATAHLAPAPFGAYGPTAAPAQMSTIQATGQFQGPLIRPGRARKMPSMKKANVAAACVNCRRAHLSCDVNRPCGRCVTSGKQDTCVDVEHKKRGRPRLRDREPGEAVPEVGIPQLQPLSAGAAAEQLPTPSGRRSRLRSRPQSISSLAEITQGAIHQLGGYLRSHIGPAPAVQTPPQAPRGLEADASNPVAFLDLNLQILKTNQAFRDCTYGPGDPRGRELAYLVQSQCIPQLQRLQSDLRVERAERDPTHLPPIGSSDGERAVSDVEEGDIARITQGFTERRDIWRFILSGENAAALPVQISLARTTTFFVVLVLPRMPPPRGRPFETPSHMSQQGFAPRQTVSGEPSGPAFSSPHSPFTSIHATATTLPPTPGTIPFSPSATTRPEQHGQESRPTSRRAEQLPPPNPFHQVSLPPPPQAATSSRSPVHDLLNSFDHQQRSAAESSSVTAQQPSPETSRRREREPSATGSQPDHDDGRKRRRLNIDEVLD
ncbi:hypothetical protein P152DRAFT_469316 [Eremomyces bilateralis CBS 781.70]|uniref:Zn(2)-C6 fungal-type domain-containing protein n=1 Tax=Eremomyces bilateralis CBS 781.70 TaxID=1392243 RepID=A0A6G1GFF4_9PEZI|nr:uncharacterized protein P152DRAFT_469316 [Eremomyces bilateralis CBS 781.70]KAF1816783.1 hypothetical protein P152DRAFT_469316 [Eremomyces bilateralis CBS 781.70]